MKKLSVLISLLLTLVISSSWGENIQLVMPKLPYIGDTVEIRYIFHSDANLFPGDFEKGNAFLELRRDYISFASQENDFTLKACSLEKISSEYTLTLTIIPWKAGFLQISPFNLTSLVLFSQNLQEEKSNSISGQSIPYIITLSPLEIKSLLAKISPDLEGKRLGGLVMSPRA